ncbi:MAG: hypothetical protein KIS81_08080 [Maricaulaceae bacterium]|nr:hypothetical protein [Maricaulaceae bacterium]
MHRFLIAAAAALLALSSCSGDGESRPTRVDAATAETALESMHLAESGDGRVQYAGRSFEGSSFVFTDVVISAPAGDESGETVHADRMVIVSPRVDADGGVMFDRLTIEGMAVVISQPAESEPAEPQRGGSPKMQAAAAENAGQVRVARIDIVRPNAAFANLIAGGFSSETQEDRDIDWSQMAFERFAIEGVDASGNDDGEPFSVRVAELSFGGFDGARLGRFALTGFGFEGADAETGAISASLRELLIEDFDASPFIQALRAESGFDETPSMLNDPFRGYSNFVMRGLDADIGGLLLAMEMMESRNETRRNGDIRQTARLQALTLRADPSGNIGAQLAMGLAMMRYQDLRFDGVSESLFEVARDRVATTGDNYFIMRDGFRIDSETDFAGFDEYVRRLNGMTGATEADEISAAMMHALEALVLHRVRLRIEDQGLLDRGMQTAAMAQGMTPDQMRAQAAVLVGFGLAAAPAEIPRPLLAQLSEALAGFISNGGAILLEANPAAPVSIGALAAQAGPDGAFDFEALGISVRAEAAE